MTTPEVLAKHQLEPQANPATPLLTLDRLYVFSVVVLTVAAALHVVVQPHDFWWHLANGRTIVETGGLPTADQFTFTQSGRPFFNQMWLAQVLMYNLHRAGGVELVVVAHAAAIGVTSALLLRLCIKLTRQPRLAAVVVLGLSLPLSFPNWAVRPQPYVLPMFVAFIWLLLYAQPAKTNRYRLGSWWLLPGLMVLWVNLHGSFALGLAAITTVTVVEVVAARIGQSRLSALHRQSLVAAALLTWAATMVNPRGVKVFAYATDLMTNPSVRTVSEWQPVTPSDVMGVLYFMAAAVVMLLMVYGARRPYPAEATLVIALLLLGFTAGRHTIWFALAATPLASLQVASLSRKPAHRDPGIAMMNATLAGLLGIVLLVSLPWPRQALAIGRPLLANTPVASTAHLATLPDPPQRLFNDLGYGSYLAWALPQQRTFIDPRFELFPSEQIEDYRTLTEGRDVAELSMKYRFDGFFVSQSEQPALVKALEDSPDWRLVYEDAEAALFVPRVES